MSKQGGINIYSPFCFPNIVTAAILTCTGRQNYSRTPLTNKICVNSAGVTKFKWHKRTSLGNEVTETAKNITPRYCKINGQYLISVKQAQTREDKKPLALDRHNSCFKVLKIWQRKQTRKQIIVRQVTYMAKVKCKPNQQGCSGGSDSFQDWGLRGGLEIKRISTGRVKDFPYEILLSWKGDTPSLDQHRSPQSDRDYI